MTDFNLDNVKKSTKIKLRIIREVFNMWLTVWQGNNQLKWIDEDLYVIDLFAGKGFYTGEDGKEIPGSFIIFLEVITGFASKLKNKSLKLHLFGVESKTKRYNQLKKRVDNFKKGNPELSKDIVEIKIINGDSNKEIDTIISEIKNTNRNPLFILIDPTGLQIKRTTMEKIVNLKNPKDILFNYILEGVRRTSGVASKIVRGEHLSRREFKTVKTLIEFLGDDIDIIKKKRLEDLKVLEEYAKAAYKNLCVVGYNVQYPDRKDDLYYLLFASRNEKISKIVKDIYAREKRNEKGLTLFEDFYYNSILEICKNVVFIKRKRLLYQTKVEYGDWTINHVIGCAHGCKFPCYAMMLAKRFGWVKDYDNWRKPRITENAIEILEKEIPKYKNKIKFVHLSFMTDPFMYDSKTKNIIPEVKELTFQIIALLNKNGIKVTTLTKGFYPEDLLSQNFLKENEYGITLISLNNEFKEKFEPYSSPYKKRINSLKLLHDAGLKTWVSIEPYPTPNLDKTAKNIDELLNKIKFVDKVIFGKINYNTKSKYFVNSDIFYQRVAQKVIRFCKENNIKYHIKLGTPHSGENTEDIFT